MVKKILQKGHKILQQIIPQCQNYIPSKLLKLAFLKKCFTLSPKLHLWTHSDPSNNHGLLQRSKESHYTKVQ